MSNNYFHKERDIYAIGSNNLFICANLITLIRGSAATQWRIKYTSCHMKNLESLSLSELSSLDGPKRQTLALMRFYQQFYASDIPVSHAKGEKVTGYKHSY